MFDWSIEADILQLDRDIVDATFEFERKRLRELRQHKVDQLAAVRSASLPTGGYRDER
jgi:hypothetical protein